ncbi:MAG: hypothetical protein RL670_1144 [Actinomycetota bacterium]|jgi:uncharacterized membrane protein YhaH (DUF805 family)
MSFQEAIKQFWIKYATFEGRADRREYWFAILFVVLVSTAAGIINPPDSDGRSTLQGLWSLATLIPSLAIGARRLRDMGRKGTDLLWLLLPLVGLVMVIIWLCQPSVSGNEKTKLKSVK